MSNVINGKELLMIWEFIAVGHSTGLDLNAAWDIPSISGATSDVFMTSYILVLGA